MARTNRSASLVRYAKINGIGWRRGSILTAKNGRVKPDVMTYNGQEYSIPADSVYQIRSYIGNKAQYISVGSDYDSANATLGRYLATRQLEAAQEALGIAPPADVEVEAPRDLPELLAAYLTAKKSPSLNLSTTSIRHYEDTLPGFVRHCGRKIPCDIGETDITSYMDDLIRQGYSQKTRMMRYVTVRGFLRSCGVDLARVVDVSTHRRLSAKPEGNTAPYAQAELDKLFAACDEYHRLVYQFLLATGLRYREANHLTWSNLDFTRGMITIPFEQKVNRKYRDRTTGKVVTKGVEFQTKSRRKREVPIFPSLRPLLLEWRAKNPDRVYIFGSKRSDMPDNHWLEYGKRAWRKAGLNCGVCDTCIEREQCEGFFLHKFRHTFAHRCLDSGLPIHRVSKWLGHHSIEITAVYLSGGSLDAEKDPFAVCEGVA